MGKETSGENPPLRGGTPIRMGPICTAETYA